MTLSEAEIRRRVGELAPWFHNMTLGGVQTAPDHFLADYPANKFERFKHVLPDDLSGTTVLDIGCNAGFHAIEMKRRGALRVVRSEEHTSELQSLMRISYAVFCLKKTNTIK